MSDGGAISNPLRRNLPPEIITDILSRLPVKSLCRCKCVSPSWNFLISSHHFAKTHLNRQANTNYPKHLNHNIILTCRDHNLYSVNLTPYFPIVRKLDFPSLRQSEYKWVKVLNSCNGLLLLSDEGNSNLLLLNPSTGQCKKLPTLPVLDLVDGCYQYNCGVGYDSSTDDYKVVMISQKISRSDTTTVAVYSLKTDTWRRIQGIHYIPWRKSFWVFFNGCLHGICRRNGNGSIVIVAFDLSDEIFREVPRPPMSLIFYRLEVIAGCLCLVNWYSGSEPEFWMMKEYGVQKSWTRFPIHPGIEFFVWTNDHILQKVVLYDLEKEGLRDMVVCGFGAYVESLISPHHGTIEE